MRLIFWLFFENFDTCRDQLSVVVFAAKIFLKTHFWMFGYVRTPFLLAVLCAVLIALLCIFNQK